MVAVGSSPPFQRQITTNLNSCFHINGLPGCTFEKTFSTKKPCNFLQTTGLMLILSTMLAYQLAVASTYYCVAIDPSMRPKHPADAIQQLLDTILSRARMRGQALAMRQHRGHLTHFRGTLRRAADQAGAFLKVIHP